MDTAKLNDPILIQEEVETMIRYSRQTIWRYRRGGAFPPGFKHGVKLVWRTSVIEDYISQIETTGRWVKR